MQIVRMDKHRVLKCSITGTLVISEHLDNTRLNI